MTGTYAHPDPTTIASPSVRERQYPAWQHRLQRLQELYLWDAVPQATFGRV
jgi:hypothetical protein